MKLHGLAFGRPVGAGLALGLALEVGKVTAIDNVN